MSIQHFWDGSKYVAYWPNKGADMDPRDFNAATDARPRVAGGAGTAPASPVQGGFSEQLQEILGLAKALYILEQKLYPVLQSGPPTGETSTPGKPASEPRLVVEYLANHTDQIRRLYAQVMGITERLHV